MLAADIPAHTYQATFEPNKEWSTFYAAAPEIHKYWKHVVDKYGCMKHIKFNRQVCEAVWSEEDAKWKLQVKDTESNTTVQDQCDVLISATGALNSWKWPKIPGLHDFKGKLLHSASWDESYDYSVSRDCDWSVGNVLTVVRANESPSLATVPVESRSSQACCRR